MYDKEHLVEASYTSDVEQVIAKQCRYINFTEEKFSPNFFDKYGEPDYYTAKLFSYIFLYQDTVCESSSKVEGESSSGSSKIEKRKDQLKTLMFRPGEPVEGIPFIKKELGIFDEKMIENYDYQLEAVQFQSKPAYLFTITKKADVKDRKVVLQNMQTWFNRSDFSIMARNYHLTESNLIYDFDVRMEVIMENVNSMQTPSHIYYNGTWDIPTKKRETGTVIIDVFR
jgi:hypothetical protein